MGRRKKVLPVALDVKVTDVSAYVSVAPVPRLFVPVKVLGLRVCPFVSVYDRLSATLKPAVFAPVPDPDDNALELRVRLSA